MATFQKINEVDEENEKILQDEPENSEKSESSSFKPSKISQSLRKINPTKHYHEHVQKRLKGSMKWMLWITKKIRNRGAAFPLYLILVNTLYLVLGGILFMLLEKQPDPVKITPSDELADIFNILKVSSLPQINIFNNICNKVEQLKSTNFKLSYKAEKFLQSH